MMKRTCTECRWWSKSESLSTTQQLLGKCHRKAPAMRSDGIRLSAVWPITLSTDFCGDDQSEALAASKGE